MTGGGWFKSSKPVMTDNKQIQFYGAKIGNLSKEYSKYKSMRNTSNPLASSYAKIKLWGLNRNLVSAEKKFMNAGGSTKNINTIIITKYDQNIISNDNSCDDSFFP
jgi:hypothetical protein